jgi:hypothetical protein
MKIRFTFGDRFRGMRLYVDEFAVGASNRKGVRDRIRAMQKHNDGRWKDTR